MGFIKSWIFWLIYAFIPAIVTYLCDFHRETMVILYFIAILVACILWWLCEKTRTKPEEEY